MAVHAQTNYTLTTKPAKTSLLGGHFIYRVDTTQGTLTPSSANIIENAVDSPQQWGYNTHIGANGIKLRYNETTLSEWKADHLTFYKPGTNNPSLELISGINTALNIYNPTNNTKTLGLDISGLNFYGTSTSTPDVTLNADGLTLINGSIRGGIVGQDEFLYLSPQVFADEYEEYILSEDTEVDETKIYYIRSGEEGEYIYTEVSEPTGNPQENGYYEIAHASGTIPIDNYVKNNWRQIIGRKFAVDTDGNLYANGLNANNVNIEGDITATSLTIGSGSDTYDGAAAINISGYDIEIEKNGTDETEGVTVYLYPILYHNGERVPDTEIDYTHFVWYEDDSSIGTEGSATDGSYLATYGHNYRVVYDFADGAVGGGTEVQTRTVDPSKYITKISDTGITIHPEVWSNQSSYIQLDGTGMELFNNSGSSIAKYGSTARVGLNNSSRFLMNNNSLQAYDNNNVKYFEVNSNGLSWGTKTAATTDQISSLADDVTDAAKTATNYITNTESGIEVHDTGDADNYAKINSGGMQVYQDNNEVASFGPVARIGADVNGKSKIIISPDSFSAYTKDNFESLSITAITSNTDLIGTDILVDNSIKIAMDDSMASNTTTLDVTEIADNDNFTLTFTGWIEDYAPLHAGPRRLFCEEENTFCKDGTTQTATAAIKMTIGTDPAYDESIGRRNVAISYDGEDTITLTFTEASDSTYHHYYECVVVPHVIAAAPITIPDIYLNGNVYLNSGEIGDTYQYSKFHGNIADFNEVSSNNLYTKYENTTTGTTFNLGTVVCGGHLTQSGSRVYFSIPTGRLFDYDSDNTECILECDIIIRAGNQAGSGAYIMKKSSGGVDSVHLNGDYNAVTVGSTFYNMANQQKTLSAVYIDSTMQGGTNVLVTLDGDPFSDGNIYFFAGNATNSGYINNQPLSVMCSNTKITLREATVVWPSGGEEELIET